MTPFGSYRFYQGGDYNRVPYYSLFEPRQEPGRSLPYYDGRLANGVLIRASVNLNPGLGSQTYLNDGVVGLSYVLVENLAPVAGDA